jgi:response regulator RpfG family c-di-GMP phosphodiesterase
MSAKILCVDDDPGYRAVLYGYLHKQFEVETAENSKQALLILKEKGPFAVVLSDMEMPEMDGSTFLNLVSEVAPDTVRVMLTGYNDQKTASRAVNEGHIFSFINKPCDHATLVQTIYAAVRQHELMVSQRQLLEHTLNGSVKLLTDILSMSDPAAFGRAKLLRDYAMEYLVVCKHEDAEPWEIELAAMLLTLGHITVPSGLLDKHGTGAELSYEETEIMDRVAETGFSLLSNIPRLENVALIVRYQNKHYDGSGSPADSLRENEIPLGARLLKVLKDLIEREASGLSRVAAIGALRARRGIYDPMILENCAKHLKAQPSPEQQSEQIATILVKELTTRHILVTPLVTKEGMVIAPKGTQISNLILQKIHNFGTLHALVEPIQVTSRG